MKSRLPILYIAVLAVCTSQHVLGADVSYSKVSWNHVTANVVYSNMASSAVKVTPALAKRGTGSSESFGSMVGRLKPTAAITGTFFCTRSLQPTGDIVIEGKRMYSGCVGTAICVTDDGRIEFKTMEEGRSSRWQGCQAVMCGGPTLVRDGKPALSPKSEGFKDPGLFGPKRRTAVGVTEGNKLIMVSVDKPICLGDLAKLMLYLGASDAIDLDGGTSTALYYRGKVLSRPGRCLTNLLVVYETPTEYAACRSQLAPNMPRLAAAPAPSKPAQSVTVSTDPLITSLFVKQPKLPVSDTVRWSVYRPLVGGSDNLQVIGARPEMLN